MSRPKSPNFVLFLTSGALLFAGLLRDLTAQDDDAEEKRPLLLAAEPRESKPGDDELRKLLVDRYNAGLAELQARYEEYKIGLAPLDALLGAAQRLAHAGGELNDKPADRLVFLEQFLELARHVESMQEALTEVGRSRVADLQWARYVRADAEIQLLRAKPKR